MTPVRTPARRLLPFGSPARALVASFTLGLVVASACGHGAAPTKPAASGGSGKLVASKGGEADPAGPVASGAGEANGAPGRSGTKIAPLKLSNEAICALPATRVATSLPSAAPFSTIEAPCTGDDPFCDAVDRSPDPADLCFVANDNIKRAERQASRGGGLAPKDPWDGAKKPRFLDRVDAHLHLTPGEHAKLRANGFVVLDRIGYDNYANAFHDVFQEQLPLYVGIDPVLHAVFKGTELVLERVETRRLFSALDTVLKKLRRGLVASKGRYDAETLGDLDVYLGVAQTLARRASSGQEDAGPLALPPPRAAAPGGASESMSSEIEVAPRRTPAEPASLFGHDEEVLDLAGRAMGEGGLEQVTLFGRPRMVDFSQMTPRGHYASNMRDSEGRLPRYFRAMMWLSRLEFNLSSRSCKSSHPGAVPDPSETPREARDALALAEIAERSGALSEIAAFDEVYETFAGRREDVAVPELLRLMREGRFRARDPGSPERLRETIGDRFKRTARVHFMPENSPELPAIATLFGPRIVPDVAPLTRLVHDSVENRTSLSGADVGFVLGHDRSRRLLEGDLARHPGLAGALAKARGELVGAAAGRDDVYAGWLKSLLALAAPPRGTVPSFMHREAYADARLNSALVGYGQLRHAFVLLAGQGYDAYGCEIPDGYVEPLPEVYDALITHVHKMRAKAGGFARLEGVLKTLRSIVTTELSGAELGEAQRRWLGMVSEHRPAGGFDNVDSGEPPKWTGWYFDMFEDREQGASTSAAFVADYFTLTNDEKIAYLGAEGPRLGVFVVDVGGEPRAMVGPVAKGYETESPLAGERLDDDKAVDHAPKRAPWRESYAVAASPTPALGLAGKAAKCPGPDGGVEWRVVVQSERDLGPLTITLLDHHADALVTPLTLEARPGLTAFAFALPPTFTKARFGVEALHLHVADLTRSGAGKGAYDFFTSPSVFRSGSMLGQEREKRAIRPRGTGDFVIDGEPEAADAADASPE